MTGRTAIYTAMMVSLGLATVCALGGQEPAVTAPAEKFTSFDAQPGSSLTFPASINKNGTITGWYQDVNGGVNGFVRLLSGQVVRFKAAKDYNTEPASINDSGVIAGSIRNNAGDQSIGFIRAKSGEITLFTAIPAARQTSPCCINASGIVTGFYTEHFNGLYHGFLRNPDGSIVTFDAPGAVNGTTPTAINSSGTVVGALEDKDISAHGFARTLDGTFSIFDVAGNQTAPSAINDAGIIAGIFYKSSSVQHGFVRNPDGAIEGFGVPDWSSPFLSPTIVGTDQDSAVAGFYQDADHSTHGFARGPNHINLILDAPTAVSGTRCWGINSVGLIVGNYKDGADVTHGFLFTP